MSLRADILNLALPISKAIAKVHAPWNKKKITGVHLLSILPFLRPGAVLITRVNGELANLFIPGFYKHAAIVGSHDSSGDIRDIYVIEATTHGVKKTDLITFMTAKDSVALLYPCFCDSMAMLAASDICQRQTGMAYDFKFEPNNNAFYCSELIQWAYADAISPDTVVFTKRKSLGIDTVLPVDFINSAMSKSPKWSLIWKSEDVIL